MAIEDNINLKYSNKVIQKIGLCICMYDLLSASDGLVGHGSGLMNVNGTSHTPLISHKTVLMESSGIPHDSLPPLQKRSNLRPHQQRHTRRNQQYLPSPPHPPTHSQNQPQSAQNSSTKSSSPSASSHPEHTCTPPPPSPTSLYSQSSS